MFPQYMLILLGVFGYGLIHTCDKGSMAVEGRSWGGNVEALEVVPILLGGLRTSLRGAFLSTFCPLSTRESAVSISKLR
jgi:hypothetical protein